MMSLYFLVAFIVCLAGYAFHTISHLLEHRECNLKISHSFATVVIFFGYIAWGLMIALDPVKMGISDYIAIPLGLLIAIIGLVLFVLSTTAKKGFDDLDHLVTTGIYSRLRNPMYLGIIFIHIGFPILSKSLLTLISAVIWIPIILAWKYWEEQDLENKFGQKYIEYKRTTLF